MSEVSLNLHHMDLIRVTEAGAIAASRWVGRGNKEQADLEATNAMRDRLNRMDFKAEIAIGEGKKDESFGLFEGDIVGTDPGEPTYSIAVDPIEGTTPTVKGGYEAISVITVANYGALYKTECFYMDKFAVGPKIASKGLVDIGRTPEDNIKLIADALNKSVEYVTICVLDRARTQPLVNELRKVGCRIKFISDCDVTACIATCLEDSGIDAYWSVGGSPEAVIAAAAMKCMGGFLQCQEVEQDDDNHIVPVSDKIFMIDDLVKSDCMFTATGITDGKLLRGVRWTDKGPKTNTMAMRSISGTIRKLVTDHGNI